MLFVSSGTIESQRSTSQTRPSEGLPLNTLQASTTLYRFFSTCPVKEHFMNTILCKQEKDSSRNLSVTTWWW